MQAREYLSKLGDLSQTHIFAKIENVEVSCMCISLKDINLAQQNVTLPYWDFTITQHSFSFMF